MATDLRALTDDPALFLHEIDGGKAVFQEMTRDLFEKSIFLDGRIRHDRRPNFAVPLDQLLQAWRGPAPDQRPIGWIFHVAQCGSTLLARALDHPGRSLVLREPASLRRLGIMAGGGADGSITRQDPAFGRLLDVTLSLLGKRWDAAAPVVLKANVPVNFIAEEIMARMPQAPAVLLHFPLSHYLAAILRTEGHENWTAGVFEELRLASSILAQDADIKSIEIRAAILWFAQMQAFERVARAHPQTRTLDARLLFEQPRQTIEAAAGLMNVPLAAREAEAMASGELFQSYSKNPALDYENEVRVARERDALVRLAPQIDRAMDWARRAQSRFGLADALPSPLLGPEVTLFA